MNENELTLKVLSPDGHSMAVEHLLEVIVPLADGGSIGIKPKHTPLIAETVSGSILYKTADETYKVELLAGILSIRDNVVTILSASEIEENDLLDEPQANLFEKLAQVLEADPDSAEDVR